jgi:hypothetical protein
VFVPTAIKDGLAWEKKKEKTQSHYIGVVMTTGLLKDGGRRGEGKERKREKEERRGEGKDMKREKEKEERGRKREEEG